MRNTALLSTSALLFSTVQLFAASVTVVDGTADNGASLVNSFLGASSGLTVVSTSFIGTPTQSGTFEDFNLISTDASEPTLGLDDGIVLTSGSANFSTTTNTSTGFGEVTGTGSNAQVDAELAGFPAFDGTLDQNVLEFTFTVDDPTTTSIEFDFVFGSEEFSEFPGFVDSFTFFLDGVNYALFPNGDPIVQEGTTQGFFNDNEDDSYGFEFDGISDVLNLVGILDQNLTTHTATLVLADDADQILDSAVFISSLTPGTQTGGGGIQPPSHVVPLPAGLPLLLGALAGLGGLGAIRRSRRSA